jgi:HPr kinase/phosphorylase
LSEIVHATAVLVGARGVLIRGPSGAGKSTLAALLISQGARLVADDRVHLSCCHGRIVATTLAPLAGLAELRGRGIVNAPHERSAVIRLVVDIEGGEALERAPEDAQLACDILGLTLPRQPVPAASDRARLLVAEALRSL